jgi:hypothetical protein
MRTTQIGFALAPRPASRITATRDYQLTALQQVLNDLHVLQREGHAAAHVHGPEHLVDRLL